MSRARDRPNRWRLAALALAVLLFPDAAGAEEASPLLSTEVSLAAWGIDDPAAIRLGRLSVARGAAGERLDVLHLRTAGPDPEGPRTTDFKAATRKPEISGSCLVVADFAAGNRNRLGGDFNVFQRRPSSADFDLDRRPHGRRSLRVSYHRAAAGFAGWWTHLYDSTSTLRTYLDAGDFTHLSLWVRGREGGERLLLKLADERFDRLGDSLPVGELGSYLPAGRLTAEWQRATVRLADVPPALDRSRLAGLVLEATAGTGAVELGPIALCRGAGDHPALPAPAPAPPASAVTTAIWVWNTGEILDDAGLRARFLADLERGGFDQVYLQLPNDTGVPARLGSEAAGLRSLVAAIAGLGLSVRALDGHATFVEADKQPRVLATIADVAAYNAAVSAGERFDGVHYDVEPYLLPGFGGPRRDEILGRYVELVAKMAALARRHGLLLGVDLPFWYDAPDEWSGEALTVDFAGRRRPVVEHVIDLADYVTLMDYRTRAYGPDGVLAHAAGELAYAARVGKKIYLGLETGELPDEQYLTFAGEARPGLPPAGAQGEWAVVSRRGDAVTVYLAPAGGLGELGRRPAATTEVFHWPIEGRIDVPASKLTFADLGGAALAAVLRQVGHELRATPSFAGFALHHYGSLGHLRGFVPP